MSDRYGPLLRILVPVGTRPEIIKLAPVISELRKRGHDVRVVATGQHFDSGLTDVFYTALHMTPDVRWDLPEAEADRVGEILSRAIVEIGASEPDVVLVLGDTWTVPLFALAARRRHVPVVHLEAGLRSFNATSMEEVNRRVAAATAQLHLAPTDLAASFLAAEGVDADRIHVVGNSIIDALGMLDIGRAPVDDRKGIVVTAHRPTNVDDPERLSDLVDIIGALVDAHPPVTFPVHPRTRARLVEHGLWDRFVTTGVDWREPLDYREMLGAIAGARVVVTDSGGLQEEAAWFGVPVVVLRRSTPRWEGVRARTAALTGLDRASTLAAVDRFCSPSEQRRVASVPCPYGNGDTAERVADLLTDAEVQRKLRLLEPESNSPIVDRLVGGAAAQAATPVDHAPPSAPDRPIAAVLFDLDDTLYPQSDWLNGAWDDVASYAGDIAPVDGRALREELYRCAAGGSARGRIIDRALEEIGAPRTLVPALLERFRAHRQRLRPFPASIDVLASLVSMTQIGLVTDGDPEIQRGKLDDLGLAWLFDVIVFSDELGRDRRKPHVSPYLTACATLGVDPAAAVFVGDRPETDITGAVNLGMRAIRVRTGEYSPQSDVPGTWWSVDDIAAAGDLLLRSGLEYCVAPQRTV